MHQRIKQGVVTLWAVLIAVTAATPLAGAADETKNARNMIEAGTATGAATAAKPGCVGFDENALTVTSKQELERVIEEVIYLHAGEAGVPWRCLLDSFDRLAENTRTITTPRGGPAGSDVYRFSIDRRAELKPPFLLPGGGSGHFVATVNATRTGNVAIIEREGRPRWLELGAPKRIPPNTDPLEALKPAR